MIFFISSIKSDNGTEFENVEFNSFYERNGILHNFCLLRTPQHNGIVERKNKTLQEMSSTMLCKKSLLKHFWAKVVNTFCYVQNII